MTPTNTAYHEAMNAPIRRIDVGGNQGHGNPPASRYLHEAAKVAPIKSSTPRYPEPESGPGLLADRAFYIGGLLCIALLGLLGWWVMR